VVGVAFLRQHFIKRCARVCEKKRLRITRVAVSAQI